MLIASALLLSASLRQDEGLVELDAKVIQDAVIAVKMTIDGKDGTFVLGLAAPQTIISSHFRSASEGETVEVEAAHHPLGRIGPQTVEADFGPADGFIGRDLLTRYAIGFDLEKGKVRLWPKAVTADSLATWVGPGAKTSRLVNRSGGPCIEASGAGNRKFYFGLTADSPNNYLFPSFAEAVRFEAGESTVVDDADGESTKIVSGIGGLVVGAGHEWPWLFLHRMPHDHDDPELAGILCVGDLNGPRVVVDLANDRLVHRPLTGRPAIFSALAKALDLQLEDRDGRLFFPSMSDKRYETISEAELLEFCGHPTEEWFRVLADPRAKRAPLVRDLEDKLSSPMRLKLKDGRVVTMKRGE
jgi:hypothetical protein